MQNILTRLASYDYIEIQIFSDEVILYQPVDEWPVVDCLVAFYSDGFPLDKAIAYVDLRQPMVVNDLQEQYTLMDRCVCVCVCEECHCVSVAPPQTTGVRDPHQEWSGGTQTRGPQQGWC